MGDRGGAECERRGCKGSQQGPLSRRARAPSDVAASRWHHAGLASALDVLHVSASSLSSGGGHLWPARFSVALFLACFQAPAASIQVFRAYLGHRLQLALSRSSSKFPDLRGKAWRAASGIGAILLLFRPHHLIV